MIESMTYYSIQFLGDLAAFLVSDPIYPFIGLFIVLMASIWVGRLMFRR